MFAILLPLFYFSHAFAWNQSLDLPAPAPVVDEFGLLAGDEASRIDSILRKIKSQAGVEISVYIASGLRDLPIEDFSLAVAEKWKLGRKKEDRALLFVFAPKEKRMRLEVGYGLEGEITDAFSRRILDNTVRPYFREARYGEGILAAIFAIQEKIPLGISEPAPRKPKIGSVSNWILWIFVLLFFLFSFVGRFFGLVPAPYRRGGGWHGGGGGWGGSLGGGGSSWGGGGGGFGGGGSSSSW